MLGDAALMALFAAITWIAAFTMRGGRPRQRRMMLPMLYIAPDTNILLQYRLLSEITAKDLGLSDTFIWLIPATVINELDKKKWVSDRRLSARASQVIKMLERIYDGGSLHSGISVKFMKSPVNFDFAKIGLSQDSYDHRILSELITCREFEPQTQIRVAAADFGMKIASRQYGFELLEIADSLKRQEAEDEDIRLLREKVKEYESARPQLKLTSPSGQALEIGPVLSLDQSALWKAGCVIERPAREREMALPLSQKKHEI